MKNSLSCSVVIPAYNAASTIRNTLESILVNIRDTDQIIIVDDGSSDDTFAICDGMDDRILVIKQENAGPSAARNRGIELASGALVAFCDADDLWDPGKLDKQRGLFESNPDLGLCFTDYRVVDQDGTVQTESGIQDRQLPLEHTLESMLIKNPVITSSTLASRVALQDVGGFPDAFSVEAGVNLACEDYETWIAIAQHWPVAMVREVLTSYVIQSGSLYQTVQSSRKAKSVAIERRVNLIRDVARNNPDKVSKRVVAKALGDYFFRAAYSNREEGYLGSASLLLLRSIAQWPFRLKSWICLGYVCWLGTVGRVGKLVKQGRKLIHDKRSNEMNSL